MSQRLSSEFLFGMEAEFRGKPPEIPLPDDITANLAEFQEDERVFVTLPIMPVGARSRNERTYGRAAVEAIGRYINEERVIGNWGHLPVEQRSTRFDPPALRWLAAQMVDDVLWAKAVVTRDDAREYLRFSKLTNGKVGTSIYGWMTQEGELVTDVQLESIDLADPARVGILEAVDVPAVTSEMIQEGSDMPAVAELETERDGLRTRVAELETQVQELRTWGIVVAEISAALGPDTDVAEYLRKIHGTFAQLQEALGADTNIVLRVEEFMRAAQESAARELERGIDAAIAEQVELDLLRPVVKTAIGAAVSLEQAQERLTAFITGAEYVALAERLVQAEMGPRALVPPKAAQESLEQSADAVGRAREKHGI